MIFKNGTAKKIKEDLKTSDLRTNGNGGVSWRPGLKSFGIIIVLIGFLWQGAIFYAQTCDTTKTVVVLKKKVKTLQIEKAVNDTITQDYLKFIVRKLEPDANKAEQMIKQMEKRKSDLIKTLKEQLKNGDT